MLTGLFPNSSGMLIDGKIFRQTIPAQPFRQQVTSPGTSAN